MTIYQKMPILQLICDNSHICGYSAIILVGLVESLENIRTLKVFLVPKVFEFQPILFFFSVSKVILAV